MPSILARSVSFSDVHQSRSRWRFSKVLTRRSGSVKRDSDSSEGPLSKSFISRPISLLDYSEEKPIFQEGDRETLARIHSNFISEAANLQGWDSLLSSPSDDTPVYYNDPKPRRVLLPPPLPPRQYLNPINSMPSLPVETDTRPFQGQRRSRSSIVRRAFSFSQLKRSETSGSSSRRKSNETKDSSSSNDVFHSQPPSLSVSTDQLLPLLSLPLLPPPLPPRNEGMKPEVTPEPLYEEIKSLAPSTPPRSLSSSPVRWSSSSENEAQNELEDIFTGSSSSVRRLRLRRLLETPLPDYDGFDRDKNGKKFVTVVRLMEGEGGRRGRSVQRRATFLGPPSGRSGSGPESLPSSFAFHGSNGRGPVKRRQRTEILQQLLTKEQLEKRVLPPTLFNGSPRRRCLPPSPMDQKKAGEAGGQKRKRRDLWTDLKEREEQHRTHSVTRTQSFSPATHKPPPTTVAASKLNSLEAAFNSRLNAPVTPHLTSSSKLGSLDPVLMSKLNSLDATSDKTNTLDPIVISELKKRIPLTCVINSASSTML
ncbi:unnamed protein product [Cyprideis torosa]|uniref:Uncharacterized protein n=1 Tax=Cyprideis torosa TaxID=163714 RepID=A0A7R8W494_9CRUS|nr:unnamed protein product [Cyprideis torosa]CAG0879611.1 unnamed protein product [Cyprideis torosa]